MSLYIHEGNQRILWSTIKSLRMFNSNITVENQEIWFKQIIGYIYQNNKNRKLTNYELQELNKYTISFMIKELQSIQSIQSSNNTSKLNQSSISKPNLFLEPSSSHRIESKSDTYSKQFVERQKDYENMTRKVEPPQPVFQEKIEDSVIENMEELVKQHLKQRELDIENLQNKNIDIKPLINIINDAQNVSNSPIELSIEELSENMQQKKTVSWNIDGTKNTRNDIADLNMKISNLITIVQNMQKEINDLNKIIMENTVKQNMNSPQTNNKTINNVIDSEPKIYSEQNDIENY
jgi:tRNA nucleotidyltransferase/poly(A) polymerase